MMESVCLQGLWGILTQLGRFKLLKNKTDQTSVKVASDLHNVFFIRF